MGLLETARLIKAGQQKLDDVPPGIRKQVQRLIPVAGDTPKPVPGPTRFSAGAKFRNARSG